MAKTPKKIFPWNDPVISTGKRVGRKVANLAEDAYSDVRDGAYLLGKGTSDLAKYSAREVRKLAGKSTKLLGSKPKSAKFAKPTKPTKKVSNPKSSSLPKKKVSNPWKDSAKRELEAAGRTAKKGLYAAGRGIKKASKRAAPVIAKGMRGAASRLDQYASVENPPARKPPLRPMSKEEQKQIVDSLMDAAKGWPSTIKMPVNTLMARKLMERKYVATKKDPGHLSVPKFRLGWTILSMIRGVDKEDHKAAEEIFAFLRKK